MATYEVEAYSRDVLKELLSRHSHQGVGFRDEKPQLSYLHGYLEAVGARTVLVESPYTDRDYLEDYAAYYARCHAEYSRRCVRLHFFSHSFDGSTIAAAIARDAAAVSALIGGYLGFVVVKPLPWTVIGRTCLVTYGNRGAARSYPATRTYKVHVFGIELEVTSLPFQEQDKDVAACATSALWSIFNATGRLFQHRIPSPAEITKAAAAAQRVVSRTLPAGDGLSPEQMADAIRSVGLEPLHISAANVDLLLIIAAAYLRAGIPCLLIGALMEAVPDGHPKNLGRHALALAGHDSDGGNLHPYDEAGTLFAATSITRLYAHDDGVGPFARADVDRANSSLSTSWLDDSGERGKISFKPQIILLPLYHKIRVPIDSILSTVTSLDQWLVLAKQNGPVLDLPDPVEWDVALFDNADLKADVYEDDFVLASFRERVLNDDLPRYVWRVSAVSGGRRLFDLLFDATDLLQGGHVAGGLPYDRDVCLAIAALARNPIPLGGDRGAEMAAEWFKQNSRVF